MRHGAAVFVLALGLVAAAWGKVHAPPRHLPPPPAAAPAGEAQLVERLVDWNLARLASRRALFREAEAALSRGQRRRYRERLEALGDYPLRPYLEYRDLRARLGRTSLGEVEDFLRRYAGHPLERRLRRAVLQRLAREGRWEDFLRLYRDTGDAGLACRRALGLLRTGRRAASAALVEDLWLVPRSQPRACDRLFAAWWRAGVLTPELAFRRFALAMDAGRLRLARYLLRRLEGAQARRARRWLAWARQPRRLAREAAADPETALRVLHGLARRRPAEAAQLWEALAPRLPVPEAERLALVRRLAVGLAAAGDPRAWGYLEALPSGAAGGRASAWRFRLALREGRWREALAALDGLPPDEDQARRYWRAYLEERLGRPEAARPLYRELAQERGFYAFLAADRLGLPYRLESRPYPLRARAMLAVLAQPAVLRAQELYALGRLGQARREWRLALEALDEDGRQHAALAAARWGWTGQAVLTLARAQRRDDLRLRFPLAYRRQVEDWAPAAGVPPALALAVARRESAFVPDARSHRGALGLMQLLPATARQVARRSRLPYRGAPSLLDPELNLRLGLTHLGEMLARFDGQAALAAAAYNAGARRVEGWLPREAPMEAPRWIETIPLRETRHYVQAVLAYAVVYRHRLGLPPAPLRSLLGPVPTAAQLAARQRRGEALALESGQRLSSPHGAGP